MVYRVEGTSEPCPMLCSPVNNPVPNCPFGSRNPMLNALHGSCNAQRPALLTHFYVFHYILTHSFFHKNS